MTTTQADSSRELGTPPDRVESPATGASIASTRDPITGHGITIRVYDYCREHGAHTDPELTCREGL
jgi:hypothetical protein